MAPTWLGMNGVNCKEWGAKCAFLSIIIMAIQKGSFLKNEHLGQGLVFHGGFNLNLVLGVNKSVEAA